MDRHAEHRQPLTQRKVISLPKLKKAVHKVMLRYGRSRFHRKIDLIYKVLKKLHQVQAPTINEKNRIRTVINAWIAENESSSSSSDSEVLEDKRLTRAQVKKLHLKIEAINKSTEVLKNANVEKTQPSSLSNTEKDSDKHEIQVIKTVERRKKHRESKEEKQKEIIIVEEQRKNLAENDLPPCPKALPINLMKKKPILVDLTIEVGEELKVSKNNNTKENKNTNEVKSKDTKKSLEKGSEIDIHQYRDEIQKTKRQRVEDVQTTKSENRAQREGKNLGEKSKDSRKTKVQEKLVISNDCGGRHKVKSVEIIMIDDDDDEDEVFIKQELIDESVNTSGESYQSTSESSEISRMCFLAPHQPICHRNQIYYNADFDRHCADGSCVIFQALPQKK